MTVCEMLLLSLCLLMPVLGHGTALTPLSTERPALWNATWTDQLKHDLLMKYDKFARPAQHTNITRVDFNLVIKHVQVDEMRSMMVLNAWTRLQWEDEKLRWNASDYGGLTKLNVADHEVWQPDVVLYNSALGNSVDHYGNTHCLVTLDGKVLWVPPSQFSAYCDLNLRKWPYDQHTCYFFFGSWVYDGEQVFLKRPDSKNSSDGEVDLDPCDWTIVSIHEIEHMKYYSCCDEPYYNIEVVVTVQRRSPAYAGVVFTPAIVCVLLTLAVFWLPPNASEKFLLCGVTSIICCMFLIYFGQKLPSMAVHTPVIVEFYAYNLVLVCLSVLVSLVSVGLSRRPRARPVPWVFARLLLNPVVSFLLGISVTKGSFVSVFPQADCEELQERNLVGRERTESVDTTTQQSLAACSRDWTQLATALDRIMFLIYLFLFIFMAFIFYFT